MAETRYEAVIGLEIHVQLRTLTKMFCADRVQFGAVPNSQVCPVCLGLPGALPVVNRAAVELGVRAALGLGCTVNETSVFARKNYFYPDLPKGYQISQHDRPLAFGGAMDVVDGDEGTARVRIRRIHLEEDAGKSLHDRVPGATAVDLNRAGIPLAEIVTEPDLTSAAQARAFLVRLKQALSYMQVSDCNMEEGSLRVDANVSIRPAGGSALGVKTEVKNMNSFSAVERAIRFELDRQERVLRSGGRVEPVTLLWDDRRGEARTMRSKEESHDYRYIPDPDLPPLVVDHETLERVRASLPEMPTKRAARFVEEYGLTPEHAQALTATRELANYYDAVTRAGADPREAASWVMGEVLAAVNVTSCVMEEFRVRPSDLATLLFLLRDGIVSRPGARQVFAEMVRTGQPPAQIVAEKGLVQVRDSGEVERWVDEALASSPREVERYRAGEARLMAFFVGKVMKMSGGKADPQVVNDTLRDRLGS